MSVDPFLTVKIYMRHMMAFRVTREYLFVDEVSMPLCDTKTLMCGGMV